MATPWDSHLKLLMEHGAQDYVSWLIGDAIVDEELSTHMQSYVNADSFYGFHIGSCQYAIHLEFQAGPDENMGRRMCEYNIIASRKFNRPIYSIVIFLKKAFIDTVSPYIVCDHNGSEIHRFHFTVIKLWEVPTAMLFERRFQGLLPLAPLTRDGKSREVVEKVLAHLLDGNVSKDLLFLFYGLSSLAFEKTDEEEWIKRRFHVLDEILNETKAFKELRNRGREEGLKEGLEQSRKEDLDIVLTFVQARFPALMSLAEQCKTSVKSNKIVQQLVLKVGLAQSEDEARKHLLAALQQ